MLSWYLVVFRVGTTKKRHVVRCLATDVGAVEIGLHEQYPCSIVVEIFPIKEDAPTFQFISYYEEV